MTSAHLAGFVACALVACGDAAIVIEVDTKDAPASRVELFVGVTHCDDCGGGIQPPGTFTKLEGDVYLRGIERFVSEVDADGIARFRLEPGTVDEQVRFLLAVGQPSGVTTGAVKIAPMDPSSGPLRVLAKLEPVMHFDRATPPQLDLPGVQVWTDEAAQRSCVMFQREKDGAIERTFVVPDADRDCDAIEPDQCDEYIPDASTRPSSMADVTCARRESVSSNCRVGGFACDDRGGAASSCELLPYCMNFDACDCPDAGTPDEIAPCLDATLQNGRIVERLVCDIAVVSARDPADPFHYNLCPRPSIFALPAQGGTCSIELAVSAIGPYATTLFVQPDDHKMAFEVAPIEPDNCKFTISPLPDSSVTIMEQEPPFPPFVAAMKVEVQRLDLRGAVLPVNMRFFPVDSCEFSEQLSCHVDTFSTPSVFSCL